MRRIRATAPSAAGIALALALGLSACGGEDATTTTGSSQEQSDQQSDQQSDAGETVPAADLAERMAKAVQEAGSGRFATTSSAQGEDAVSEAAFTIDGDDYSVQATTTSGTETLEIIRTGGQTYLKMAATGDKWVLVDENSSDPQVAMMATMMAQLEGSMDIKSSIAVYAQAADFTVGATEDVDGVKATRYSGTLPVEAVAGQLPEEMRPMMTEALGTDPIPVELWLDAEDRPVRLVQTMTVMGEESSTTQDFSAWGESIEVTAPPADQLAG